MKLPVIPTIVVAAAITTMIALGIWQLGRAEEKEALIARYQEAPKFAHMVSWPENDADEETWLYRTALVNCVEVLDRRSTAGVSREGRKGLAQLATCRRAEGGEALVALGFTNQIEAVPWEGGSVLGILAPGPRLVVSRPPEGLEPLTEPDPTDLPNNHLAYAGQWFFFALTALVIYILALRRKQKG